MSLRPLRRLARRLGSDRRATAATEFAMVAPLLIALTAGGFEMSRAVSSSRQLTTLTESIATMLTTNTSGLVTYLSLHYAFDSAMIIFPAVLSDSYSRGLAWNNDISISMAGVSFTPTVTGCTSSCTYKANIVWTGGSAARACGTNPTSVADSATSSPATLPLDLFNTVTTPSGSSAPAFVVVVDVSYTWTPIAFPKLFGSITLKRSAYLSPRYVSQIKYSVVTGDDGFGKECPGF
jgi:Flp pilus assembly protein TadG